MNTHRSSKSKPEHSPGACRYTAQARRSASKANQSLTGDEYARSPQYLRISLVMHLPHIIKQKLPAMLCGLIPPSLNQLPVSRSHMTSQEPMMQRARLYDGLTPDHIRIARFRRSNQGRLHGTLESVHVANLLGTEYTALSYACGNMTSTRVILLNGQEVIIRRTLHDALRSVVFCTKASTLSLWADEVCIN